MPFFSSVAAPLRLGPTSWRRAWRAIAACAVFYSQALGTNRAPAEEIEWLRSAEQAAAIAEQTGKPILVYFRSANCHYCDLMQANVWQDPRAAAAVKRDFVPLKLTREDNPQAVQVLKVKGFPATIIFSTDRRYVDRLDGYVAAPQFMAAVAKMQSAAAER